jgi:hypothetical protein
MQNIFNPLTSGDSEYEYWMEACVQLNKGHANGEKKKKKRTLTERFDVDLQTRID